MGQAKQAENGHKHNSLYFQVVIYCIRLYIQWKDVKTEYFATPLMVIEYLKYVMFCAKSRHKNFVSFNWMNYDSFHLVDIGSHLFMREHLPPSLSLSNNFDDV